MILLLDDPPLRVGVRFVVSDGCIERVEIDASGHRWEAVSAGDDASVQCVAERFLLPWCWAWREGRDLFLPLREGKAETLLRQALVGVGWGSTISYAECAKRLCLHPRVVGRLLGMNRFPLVIPCHRVICSNGALGGYSGGRDLKLQLLRFEATSILPGTSATTKQENSTRQ